ncbi:MAG: hypothetical protein Q9170_001489 [Blastenia crenularia]
MLQHSEGRFQAVPAEKSQGSPFYKQAHPDRVIDALVAAKDESLLCPIRYVYNYLLNPPSWLQPQPISLDHHLKHYKKGYQEFPHSSPGSGNSISLHPQAAGLPTHTGLVNFRQSKYWVTIEETIKELLELLAQDQRCGEIMLKNKQSMADLARDQLRAEVMDSYGRFSIYMYPDASEARAQLLAESFIFIFLFDDVWENTSQEIVEDFRYDFVALLRGIGPPSDLQTPLERRIDGMRHDLLAGDQEGGNGGSEVLGTLISFCHHTQPPREGFCSVRDYLDYRYADVAASFAWACAKFAVRSSVDQSRPDLLPLLRLIGDHISIANDIASYEKERRRFDTGKASSMINLVHVISELEGLDIEAAKCVAYAWQLLIESQILGQLERLRQEHRLSIEDWKFVDACLLAVSGNLLTSVVTSRYGGDDSRVA